MAVTDGSLVIKLGVEDAIAGLTLSTEAHWNQTEEDWRVFLRDGVEQQRTGLGSRDRMNQGQCISGTVSEQGADMTRGPAVADQRDGAIGCKDA